MDNLQEDQYAVLIISRSIILIMRNASDKSCREKLQHPLYVQQFLFENRAVYEITRKNTVGLDRPQMKIRRMRIEHWIPKVTRARAHTHTLKLCNIYYFFTATMIEQTM
jgi:hypothetical protein